jgi:fibronectin type 3 domain-containing protein
LLAPRAARLEWTNVANETGYKIERRVDGSSEPFRQIATTARDVTGYVDDGLEAGKTYIYRVRAANEAGNSAYSNTAAVTVPERPAVPLAPRLVTAVAGPRAVRLSWTNVAGETGYRIERKVDGSAEGFREIRAVGANVTTIVDEGLTTGTTYVYRVRASGAAGNSPYSNSSSATPRAETPRPAAPRELRATAASPTRVDLRWGNVSGETGYRIERRLDGTDTWVKVTLTAADVTAFSDTTVLPGMTYLYRVRAVSAAGSSAWSNTASAKTPDAPVAATAAVFSATRILPLGTEPR